MSANQVALAYLAAAVLFILSLKGLSSPVSARRGNIFGMVGMVVAVLTTLTLTHNYALILACILIGGSIGGAVARKIEMTSMPELVAAMHSLVGLAAVFIAVSALNNPVAYGIADADGSLRSESLIELFIGTFVGAITFTGSVVAFGKLSGKIRSAPVSFAGQHWVNLALGLAMLGFGVSFFITQSWMPFIAMTAIALLLGVLLIIPIGGADMPTVIALLNSYAGLADALLGFVLNSKVLIVAGALDGASGFILAVIMCKAMNRSFINVMLGGFGAAPLEEAVAGGAQKSVRSGSPEDAAYLMGNAESIVIVPGYGLAVARAQHAMQEMTHILTEKGIKVRYAIHPVAGRMPGHMNVLLAEAEVPYEQVLEMDEINSEFSDTDVVLVVGANDVVNPAAKNNPGSPIYGMPILEAYKARTIIVVKRSMAAGYSGLDNDLFYMDKTMMVFGDAKKVVEEMVKSL